MRVGVGDSCSQLYNYNNFICITIFVLLLFACACFDTIAVLLMVTWMVMMTTYVIVLSEDDDSSMESNPVSENESDDEQDYSGHSNDLEGDNSIAT